MLRNRSNTAFPLTRPPSPSTRDLEEVHRIPSSRSISSNASFTTSRRSLPQPYRTSLPIETVYASHAVRDELGSEHQSSVRPRRKRVSSAPDQSSAGPSQEARPTDQLNGSPKAWRRFPSLAGLIRRASKNTRPSSDATSPHRSVSGRQLPTAEELQRARDAVGNPRRISMLNERGGKLERSTRKVGDKGPPRLLCLDGSGGVRGLSSLLLLKEFLYRVAKHKGFTGDGTGNILPCEYFDMICGTGTGGLIAIMLGKLRMTVDEAIDKYLELSKHIFAKKKWIWKEGRYSARNLEFVVKNIVGERSLLLKLPGYDLASTSLEDRGKRIMMRESKSDPSLCKVFVCARQVNDSCEEVNIRSYSFDKSQQEDLTIWEAARATTASPYFFKPLRIPAGNGRRVGGVYIDAAVGHNNPIKRLLAEARREFLNMENAFILSLGSGIQDLIHLPRSAGFSLFRHLQALTFLQKVAVDCESVHQDACKELHKTPYFRLNVDRGVHGISHDAWNQVDAIYQSSMAYMQRGETDTYIDRIVDAFIEGK